MNKNVPCHSDHSRERGSVFVYVAILALVLIGLLGLAVDGAFMMSTGQQLQHAADAAALNAVRFIRTETDTGYPDTRAAAMAIALANEAARTTIKLDANADNHSDGDIVVGFWDTTARTFTPTLTDANAVRVHANRSAGNADGQLSLIFGPIFDTQASDVGATSTAVLLPADDPLVLVLDPTSAGAMSLNGNNNFDVRAGRVHANSSDDCGIRLNGNPTMLALISSVVGGACYPSGSIVGRVLEHANVIPDPLADVLPSVASWDAFKAGLPLPAGASGKIGGSGIFNPGYYPNGIKASGGANIVLNPGSYMFGKEVTLHGGAFVTGTNVTLFIDKGADIDMSGGGAGMRLTPPAEGSLFHGITLFMHRQTTGKAACKIGGGGMLDIEGIVYVPNGELELAGNPGKQIGAIIAWQLTFKGNTAYVMTGEGVPPLGTAPDSAYLVE